jgi:hypothetical protein
MASWQRDYKKKPKEGRQTYDPDSPLEQVSTTACCLADIACCTPWALAGAGLIAAVALALW